MKSNQKLIEKSKIKIKTTINKTENPSKVKTSIKNITNQKIEINEINNELIVEGDLELLKTLKKLIRTNDFQEISEMIFNKNKKGKHLKFYVNKQAAYHNKFHILDEDMSSLHDIEVSITSENLDEVIDWIMNK